MTTRRFPRPSPYRLQVSIMETRRVGGKVRHEQHIASLGSIETPLSVAIRVVFWQRVHERLAKPSNQIDPATQAQHVTGVERLAAVEAPRRARPA
jgi:hypothetical protein